MNTSPPVVAVNPQAVVPLIVLLSGYVLLFFALLILRDAAWSMAGVLLGGGLIAAGSLFVPETPALLPIANLAAALYLMLQGLGICTFHCGGFADYRTIGAIPTAWAGTLFHLALAAVGMMRPRWRWMPADLYRALLAIGQGASLYFLAIMAMHQHWCPSCASAHAAMIAQAILLVRLSERDSGDRRFNRLVYVASVLISALAINAIFHHRYERPDQSPSDALVGYLTRLREQGETIGLPVDVPTTSSSNSATVAPTVRVVPAREPLIAQREDRAHATLANTLPLRTEGFQRWGNPDAPIVIRAHMSLSCPGCRAEWAKVAKLRAFVSKGTVQIHFMFTWAIEPRTHYGASLGTMVLYACGMLGEEELLMGADKLFGAEGSLLIDRIDTVLSAEAERGAISLDTEKDALAQLIAFLDGTVDGKALTSAYVAHRDRIDDAVKANISWIFDNGLKDTPRYFYLNRVSADGRAYLNTTSLDDEVVRAYINRGLNKTP